MSLPWLRACPIRSGCRCRRSAGRRRAEAGAALIADAAFDCPWPLLIGCSEPKPPLLSLLLAEFILLALLARRLLAAAFVTVELFVVAFFSHCETPHMAPACSKAQTRRAR
jgi:hypothetical protein